MFSLVMRNSLANLWRTILIIAGIAFAVSIMISANIVMDSAKAAFRLHFEDDTYHDLEIQASFSENFSFTPELEEYLAGPRIAEVNLVLERLLPIRSVFPFYVNQSEADPGFRVVGFSGNGSQVEELHNRYWRPIDQPPASLEAYLLSYDVCAIDADVQTDIQRGTNLAILPGSTFPAFITMNLTSQPNIAFIIDGQRFGVSFFDQVWEAFFNIELLWDSWDPDNRPVSAIRIKLNDWTQIFDVKDQLEGQLGNDISVKVLRKIGEEQLAGMHSYEDALQAVVLIATAIEFLFVFSQMVVIVFTERRREIGQLRILGATRFGILKMVLGESLIYGIIGSFIGAYIGMVGSALLTSMISPQLASTTVEIVVDLRTVGFGIFYGTLITVLAALLPSAYVAYQPPQQAVQSYGRSANQLGSRA
ncbi:MAG: ABC transporter permease, partial [Candidatus Hodarchaeales archaeon]